MSELNYERNLPKIRNRPSKLAGLDQAVSIVPFLDVLDQLAEGVIVTDCEGRITYVNDAAVRIHGVKQLQVEPKDYANIYHLYTEAGEPYPPLDLPLARAVRQGETSVDARWRIRRPDGSEVLAIGTAQPLYDGSGKQSGAILTIRDDTARHRAEVRVAELNRTLETRVEEAIAERETAESALQQSQKMEAVGRLTGGIAHDFNNILTIISGSLELIGHCREDSEKRDRHLDNIRVATQKAATLTERLLAFSRRQPLAPKSTDINDLIAGMSELFARTIGADIALETEFGENLPAVTIDGHRLETAILNLVVNSRDAMADGGTLGIATRLSEMPAAGISAGCVECVEIAVTDCGAGIAPDIIPRVFEPFFTTKDVGKGTGLGLSMVYGFIKQSRGEVKIASQLGRGTTIRLLLPLD